MSEPVLDFSEIHQAYRSRVHAYAVGLLGSEEAEDVTQEVFVKISRSLGSLEDPSKLSSWIYAITLNTVRDVARKRSPLSKSGAYAPRHGDEEPPLSQIEDVVSRSPEEDAVRNEMVACYLDYVRDLRPRYFEVYVLSEFEHLSDREIANRLSVTLNTVKIRLHRARAELFAELRRDCRCYQNDRGELMGEPKGR